MNKSHQLLSERSSIYLKEIVFLHFCWQTSSCFLNICHSQDFKHFLPLNFTPQKKKTKPKISFIAVYGTETFRYTQTLCLCQQQATIINKSLTAIQFIMLPRTIFMYTHNQSPTNTSNKQCSSKKLQINKGYLISRSLSHNDPISVHRQLPISVPSTLYPSRIRLATSAFYFSIYITSRHNVLIASAMHTHRKMKPQQNICFFQR